MNQNTLMKVKMKKMNFKIDMAFIFCMAFFILLCLICGCSNTYKRQDIDRISITGSRPVIIEQNYENENGNIRYVSKIEILGDRKLNSIQR